MSRKIIDIHTHIFPDELAERAVRQLTEQAGESAFTDGTAGGLVDSMKRNGIMWGVTQPVSTRGAQTPNVNTFAIHLKRPGLINFGTLHPDYPDYAGEIRRLCAAGIKGVKFHPDYQKFYVDEERLFPVYEAMAEAGLVALFHAGVDIGLAPPYHGNPDRMARVLDRVPQLIVVAAHFGGFQLWDDVDRYLVGRNLYLESSYTLAFLAADRFVDMARRHGIDRVMFGSDSPWADQGEEIRLMEKSGLTDAELDAVFYDNAARLLRL